MILGTAALLVFKPLKYRAEAKLLLRNNRVEPTLGAATDSPQSLAPVTPEEVNSEVELLKSSDVLRYVVTSMGLAHRKPNPSRGI